MALAIDFPCNLPAPKVAAYSYEEVDHVRSNDVQSGPPRYELLEERTPGLFNVSWSFSESEFQLFEGWWRYKALWGAIPFLIDLPVAAGILEHEANLPRYTRTRVGKRWTVSGTLVAVEVVYQSDECIIDDLLLLSEELLQGAPGGLGGQINAFNSFAETTLGGLWSDIKYGTDYS